MPVLHWLGLGLVGQRGTRPVFPVLLVIVVWHTLHDRAVWHHVRGVTALFGRWHGVLLSFNGLAVGVVNTHGGAAAPTAIQIPSAPRHAQQDHNSSRSHQSGSFCPDSYRYFSDISAP